MDWLLCDVVFTGKLSRTDYDASFVWEWRIYYSGRFPGTVSDALGHHRVRVFFTLVQVRLSDDRLSKDTITLSEFNVRVIWLKIVDKTA